MKSIVESIKNSINEAKRIRLDDLSDGDLLLAFWDAWSGFYDPRKIGVSSNPRAQRLEEYIYHRFEDERGIDGGIVSDMISNICPRLHDKVCDMMGYKRDTYRVNELGRIHDEMKREINDNLDDLMKGKKIE